MSTYDLSQLARPPRAILPSGDVPLGDGRVLFLQPKSSDRYQRAVRAMGYPSHTAIYQTNEKHSLMVMASVEPTQRFGDLLHISMSYPHQNPSWKDIRLVKEAFYGDDRDAMMVLPRKAEYVNFHPYCFHLWECPQAWGLM